MSWEDSIKKIEEGDKYALNINNWANTSMKSINDLIVALREFIKENPTYKDDLQTIKLLQIYNDSLQQTQEALSNIHIHIMAQWEHS